MLDLFNAHSFLELGILEEDPLVERAVHGHKHVFVYGRGEKKSSVVAVIGRKVGPTAAEAHPQRTPRNNHSRTLTGTRASGVSSGALPLPSRISGATPSHESYRRSARQREYPPSTQKGLRQTRLEYPAISFPPGPFQRFV